jgi:hypothetical protein
MKICKKCNKEKELIDFSKHKRTADGYNYYCKECNRNYRLQNKDRLKEYNNNYYCQNKEKLLSSHKDYLKRYYKDNKDEFLLKSKDRWENNKEDLREYNKKYYLDNKQKIKAYQTENQKIISENRKIYRDKNKETINEKRRLRRGNDQLYRCKENIRCLIKESIKRKGFKKTSKTEEILGCSFEEFKIYLESKFEPWMTWDNYGKYNGEENYGWDIDHIIPVREASSENEVMILNHFSNLQPLCSYINRVVKK